MFSLFSNINYSLVSVLAINYLFHSSPEQYDKYLPRFIYIYIYIYILLCYFPCFPYFALLNTRETNHKKWEIRKIYVIRELTEKELVEERVSLIIKSLVCLSETISSFHICIKNIHGVLQQHELSIYNRFQYCRILVFLLDSR